MENVKLCDVIRRANIKVDKDNTDLVYYVGGEHIESENIRVSNRGLIAGSTIGPMFYYGFKSGDFLLVSRNPHLRKAGLVDFDGICSEKTFVLETADPKKLIPQFLPFILQNERFWKYAYQNRHGSTNTFINWSTLANYRFELPDPDTQRNLATVLWSINDTIEAYRKLIAATDELVKSQFIDMFGKRDGAIYCTLEECCVSVTGGSTPSMKHEEYYGGEVPFIKSGDVKADYVSSGALWLTQLALDETTAKYVPAGTVVVVTRSGILKHNLPVAITSNPVVINQDLKAFEPKPEFSPQYIAWAIRSREDELLSKTRVMTVDNIESKDLYEIPVMIASREDQEQFAAFVRQSDKSKFELEKALSELTATYKRILAENLG